MLLLYLLKFRVERLHSFVLGNALLEFGHGASRRSARVKFSLHVALGQHADPLVGLAHVVQFGQVKLVLCDSDVDPEEKLYFEPLMRRHFLGRVAEELLKDLDFALGVVHHIHPLQRAQLSDIFTFDSLL